jgi:SAM-dependent MidA family methyltransferase
MECGLYGPDGFFTRPGPGPAGHFRTSVHASPAFAGAIAELVGRLDAALDHPDPLDLVDVGGGRGELLAALQRVLPEKINSRVRATVVELAPRPSDLPGSVRWTPTVPDGVTGLLIATEWLDNVPLDVVEVDDSGAVRYVLVGDGGEERLGPPVDAADAAWLARWWPLDDTPPGTRAEVGAPRDAAWARTVGALTRGVALTIDYGHLREDRPAFGTLTGYRDGRQVTPVPDGSCDLTAHVAIDAVAAAPDVPYGLFTQRAALRALGVDGGRPPLELAYRDAQGYLAALAQAGAAAELTDPAGLGGHYWLLHQVDAPLPAVIPGVG